ncbi:MAG: hypothetical protein R2744_14060 [Bacteroidales bacterium]
MAIKYDLPIVIHTRNPFDEASRYLSQNRGDRLRGGLSAFTGNSEQAFRAMEMGFILASGES